MMQMTQLLNSKKQKILQLQLKYGENVNPELNRSYEHSKKRQRKDKHDDSSNGSGSDLEGEKDKDGEEKEEKLKAKADDNSAADDSMPHDNTESPTSTIDSDISL